MLKGFAKIVFSRKRPKIVLVASKNKTSTAEAIFQVLRKHLKVKKVKDKLGAWDILTNEVFIFEHQSGQREYFEFLIRNSRLAVFVMTLIEEDLPVQESFAVDIKEIGEFKILTRIIPSSGFLVLNFDDRAVRDVGDSLKAQIITFAIERGADFQATDIKVNEGTNFKINHDGKVIPVWLDNLLGNDHIYSALAAAAVGEILGLNLVKISEALKDYKG